MVPIKPANSIQHKIVFWEESPNSTSFSVPVIPLVDQITSEFEKIIIFQQKLEKQIQIAEKKIKEKNILQKLGGLLENIQNTNVEEQIKSIKEALYGFKVRNKVIKIHSKTTLRVTNLPPEFSEKDMLNVKTFLFFFQ